MHNLFDFIINDLFFFLSWIISTFVCPTEILAFSDRIEEFRKINTEVIACSVDSHFTHLAWINTPRKEVSKTVQVVTDNGFNVITFCRAALVKSTFRYWVICRIKLLRTMVFIWMIWAIRFAACSSSIIVASCVK